MLNFSPPPSFHDISEYTFTDQNRRVIVRGTAELGSSNDLLQVAQDFAAHLQNYLGAQAVEVSEIKQIGGGSYVTVSAQVVAGSHPLTERVAFIYFENGKAIQLGMSANPADNTASDEFQSLIQSARPAPPHSTGRRLLRHEPKDIIPKERYAGAVTLELSPNYRNVTMFRFRDPEKNRMVSIKVDEQPPPRDAAPGRGLFAATATAVDDLGKSFSYESGRHLWKPRTPHIKASLQPAAFAAPLSAVPPRSVEEVRQIGNTRVTVQVLSDEPDPGAEFLAKTVSASIGSDEARPR